MAATTISRASITDDSGAGTDGTILNSAWFGTAIYDKVDELFTSTSGLVQNQGTGDGYILTWESSDVAHGMTSLAATNIYAGWAKDSGTDGGVRLQAFSEATRTFVVSAFSTTDDTTKSTSGVAPVMFESWTKSGTTAAAVGANANIVAFRTGGTTRFLLDGDGDSHQDVGTAWTNFDAHDDVALLTAVSGVFSRLDDPLKSEFADLVHAHRDTLAANRIVTFNDAGDGRAFINWSRMHMLHIGATRQLAQRIDALEAAREAR